MNQKNFFLIPVLFFFFSIPLSAQLFAPFTSLNVIKTGYFDIIFPSESEPSARLLASYADDVYEELSSLFGIKASVRIPVTFTPHTDMFNGYYSSIPAPLIVLYDTPMNPEWTNFDDSLKSLFLHELVHAITLNSRTPFFQILHRIFGNWVSPAGLSAPSFMVEGATVSMESLSGFGRANDPLIKQKLRQAVHENKFPAPFQASGVYDYPGQSGNWYDYGGLFSMRLIENFGIEKFAELWQAMGKIPGISFFVYRSGFYRIYKKIYGVDFIEAWNEFKSFYTLNDLEENHDEVFKKKYHFFDEKRYSISALASADKNVYVLNSTEGKIHAYDTQTEKTRSINADSFVSYDLDVSPDNQFLLVSGYHITGKLYSSVINEIEAASGRKTGRTVHDLYKARYFRNGIVGIYSQLHNNCIVYDDFNGNREVLFTGNEELVFSGPQVLDKDRIAFIAVRKGLRELLLFNYATRELFRIESASDDTDDRLFWQYMRGLRISEGKLFFSHNADDRMYKPGIIDLDGMQAVFSGRNFSGGVFYPVSVSSEIYYSGRFFSGDGFMRFPETADALSGKKIGIRLSKIDNIYNSALAVNLEADENIIWDMKPGLFPQEKKSYLGLKYMSPLNLWLPLPMARYSVSLDNFNFSLDGFGIFSIMADPAERHFIDIFAYADVKYRMAMIERFNWRYNYFGFPLTIFFSDKVINDFIYTPHRETRVTLGGSFFRYPGGWMYGFSLSGGYIRFANDDGGNSAYEWEETGSAFFYSGGFQLSNLRRRQHEIFGNGYSLNIRGISFLEDFLPRAEGILNISAETLIPFNLAFYGAYDQIGMNLHGISRSYGKPVFENAASEEYKIIQGLNLNWLAGCEISAGIFSLEIQGNLSHIYFNRLFGKFAFRNVIYDGNDCQDAQGIKINNIRLAQSLAFKLGLVTSIIPVKAAVFFIEPNVWGAWKFSNMITGEGDIWGYGFGVNFRY